MVQRLRLELLLQGVHRFDPRFGKFYMLYGVAKMKMNNNNKNFPWGLPWWSSVKNLPTNARNPGSIPGLGSSHMLWRY